MRAARQAAIQPESRDWRGPVVVVSALGGVTDRLLGVAAEAGAGDVEGAREHVRALRARHLDVARRHHDDAERAPTSSSSSVSEFDELERIVGALGVLREVSPRWLDAIAATGEILSSRIVAAALTSHGLAASWVDARQRARHRPASTRRRRRSWPETTAALSATRRSAAGRAADSGRSAASSARRAEGVTTTLGRGGSDYSAAIVGACLDATRSRSGPTSTAC